MKTTSFRGKTEQVLRTGVSSWDVPDRPSSSVPVVNPTPQPDPHPYSMPQGEGSRSLLGVSEG